MVCDDPRGEGHYGWVGEEPECGPISGLQSAFAAANDAATPTAIERVRLAQKWSERSWMTWVAPNERG